MQPYPVGTLVRIVYSKAFPQLIGEVCMITEEYQEFADLNDGSSYWGYCVDIDEKFGPEHWQLEPISDGDINKVIAWDECLWQPTKEIA